MLEGWEGANGRTPGRECGRSGFSPSWLCPPAHSRYLRQQAEVSVQNGAVGLLEEFLEAGPHEVERVGRGQLGKELVLLRLVVQDFGLRVTGAGNGGGLEDCSSRIHLPVAPQPQSLTEGVFISHFFKT